ncbi:hypothetical protein GCM10010218_64160 [Streptomyces mashuensis]|uniref:Uncharacterized protein n=1 Tax=Streptomyces mashuensis TaxID=33904 RepID=A0A919B9R5_9ACTN|nr:hypothetical protein [Streptomyces mashuensis]GHF74198.1 hypothetical protein GCM10010218_64160 [Streptomyces mashuensis]
MPYVDGFQVTPEELKEVFARLQPYLPRHLKKVTSHSYGLGYEFEPFTGREPEPSAPSTHDDPKLRYVRESEDEAEYQLRQKAGLVLSELYQQAREEWRSAAYVADLKTVVEDAPALWRAYQDEATALAAAYDYLRTPNAAAEWPSAVSRLVDAQDRTTSAAVAFDGRAAQIAEVHDTHLYARLGRAAALEAAGYPDAEDWPIGAVCDYGRRFYGRGAGPLEEQVRDLIEQQDAHLAKVSRLAGTVTGRPAIRTEEEA